VMLVALVFLVATALAARISYEGQQILRCSYENPTVIAQLQEVLDVQGIFAGYLDVRARTPQELEYIKKLTTNCEVKVADLEMETQKFEALNLVARSRADADWFDAYHTLDEITSWYRDVAARNPQLVTFVNSIGSSSQGRDLFAIRIFDRTTNSNAQPSKRIYWTGQIHAREWISGATVSYLVNQTLENFYKRDSIITSVLKDYEIVVVPNVNPDGYVWTWTNDRQWRKNRRVNGGIGACPGVDQNRNYDDNWGKGGSSNQSCSDTYMGPTAASESEVQAVQNYFLSLQRDAAFVGAIDWHSYSQLVLRPYGWTSADSPDETVLKAIGDKYAADILATSGKVYTSQKSIQLYVTTGTASDWYYGNQSFAGNQGYRVASYTVELRPVGAPGFELPPREIIPTGEENWVAIRNWLDYLHQSPIYRP